MRIIRRPLGAVSINQHGRARITRTMTVREIITPDGTAIRHVRKRLRPGIYDIDTHAVRTRDIFRRLA